MAILRIVSLVFDRLRFQAIFEAPLGTVFAAYRRSFGRKTTRGRAMIYGWKAENPVQEAWRVERVRRDTARLRDETPSVNCQYDIPGVQSNEATASVLLVEDDELVRPLFRRMLERGGFSVVTAINGRDGVERFREHPVDIVITDMMMPVMGGDDLIRRLVLDRPDVRIIAVSGVEYPYLRTALGLGAKATLRKPVQAERLLETVRRVLAA